MTDSVAGSATVRAPATSANLGPGFDAFGLALGLYDEVTATVTESGVGGGRATGGAAGRGGGAAPGDLEIQVNGAGADELPRDETHLVVRSMHATWQRLGVPEPPGLHLSCVNQIPHGRGLGSSAAAIVSGVRLAVALMTGREIDEADALALAAELEGHPDNVAACLLGGLTIAWRESDKARAVTLGVHPEIRPVAFVSPEPVSTEMARGLLPAEVQHVDAAANAGRAGLLVAALTQRPDLLLTASEDRLHQDYRRSAMPQTLKLVEALRASGVPAVVSGAGPTVLALGTTGDPVDVPRWTPDGWLALELAVDTRGAQLVSS
jgi:homoserine kinase